MSVVFGGHRQAQGRVNGGVGREVKSREEAGRRQSVGFCRREKECFRT